MTKQLSNWLKTLKVASLEGNHDEQRSRCDEARQILQQRLVEIAGAKGRRSEERSVEEGLRRIWALEQKIDRRAKGALEKSNRPAQE